MNNLIERYDIAFSNDRKSDFNAWFSEDCPQEQIDLLENLEASEIIAADMVLEGITNWNHLGWWRDVLAALNDWCLTPLGLIKVQMVSKWLIDTIPENYQDGDVLNTLYRLAEGEFCEVFEYLSSRWPATPEFYLSNLNWRIVEVSLDSEADDRATRNAYTLKNLGYIV